VRDVGEYSYESYRGDEPTLEADVGSLSSRSQRSSSSRSSSSRGSSRQRQPH